MLYYDYAPVIYNGNLYGHISVHITQAQLCLSLLIVSVLAEKPGRVEHFVIWLEITEHIWVLIFQSFHD